MPNNSKSERNDNLTVCMLASGSKGNSIYISDGITSILVDAGLSGIEIERRLKKNGLNAGDIDAILVTHEHSDHIQGVGVLSRRYDIPVYISRKTSKAAACRIGTINNEMNFETGCNFIIKTLKIHPFSTSHDADDPAGFTVNKNKTKIGIATDLGIATGMVKEHLKDCLLLILEANHDPTMLAAGPYPWPLKQRIKSRTGHLSNNASRMLLSELRHDQLKYVILAHLSEINNTPQQALSTIGPALTNCKTQLEVAVQDDCGELFNLT